MQKEEKGLSHKKTSYTEQIHLSDYLAIIKKRKWLVIIFSLILIGAVSVISFILTPVYQATTRIIIERMSYPVTKIEESENRDLKEQDFYQTQYNLLQSRNLALKVIEDLKLYKEIQSGPVSAQTSDTVSGKNEIIDWYLANLKVEPVPGTRLINVSFLSPSPKNAARIANAHVNAFINWSNNIKLSSSQQRLNWLNIQIQKQKEKLEASQEKMNDYKRTQGIVAFEDRQNIVSQQMMDLNANLTRVKSERMTKQAAYEQLKSFSIEKENIFALPEVAHDPVILNIRNQFLQLKAKKLEMAANYGPIHPKMIDIDSRIKQLEQEIILELQRLSRTIKAELDRALDNERSIQKTLNAQKGAALSINEKAMANDILKQETQSNQQSYDDLLKQAKEVGLSGAMENSNISIVDEAEIPLFPVRPKIFLNILLAIVVSMFMGPFLAFFFEYMDRTVKTPDDVRRRLGLSVLGMIPFDKSVNKVEKQALSWNKSSHEKKQYGYAYDNVPSRLVTSLQLTNQGIHGQVLMVESATSGEGKTSILSKSAVSLARGGLRVLMVDADLERPALHRVFGFKNDGEGGLITAMQDILSQDMSQGNLTNHSIDDLFFFISLKKLSGQLSITNDQQEMTVLFENGRLFQIQSKNNPLANRLGTMLLRGGFMTESQLQEALERNERTGQPLGYILINAGYITQDKLRGPLKLQMEEYLQKLFSWKSGAFVFEPKSVETCEDKKIYFGEDYTAIIRHLGHIAGSRFTESVVLSQVKHLGEPNLSLLPAGRATQETVGPVYFMILEKFLNILKKHFDIILVDAPPVLVGASAVPLSLLSDGVVFVVKAGHLSAKVINEATASLKEANINILGAVLNQVKIGKDDHEETRGWI
jgi:succinoglycan biosynthesis transport protein ExoP